LNNPEQNINYIHIAGTNGKGSTSFIIAEVLRKAGYKVGLFTSPHMHSYRERITVNGQQISDVTFLQYLNLIKDIVDNSINQIFDHPTEFEVLTAVAFQYFKDLEVDIAVIETGMGGIWDSTNVVTPLVSVITSIDYDHTVYLGSTLAEIAANKAGIIKKGVPVVVGPMEKEALKVVEYTAKTKGAPLYKSEYVKVFHIGSSLDSQIISLQYPNGDIVEEIPFTLLGKYQLSNLACSLTALSILSNKGFNVSYDDIKSILPSLKVPGRMEIIHRNPDILLDAAHNPHGAKALAASLQQIFSDRKKTLVCGMVDDKDVYNTLRFLGDNTSCCIVTRPQGPRGDNWQQVLEIWHQLYTDKRVYAEENIIDAIQLGLNCLREKDYLLITGSFYILDTARRYLKNKTW